MKKVLLFVGLKIAELGALAIIPYLLGLLPFTAKFCNIHSDSHWHLYLDGWAVLAFSALGLILLAGLASLVYANWLWVDKLTKGGSDEQN